jgi:GT2 family glycosyltransferase
MVRETCADAVLIELEKNEGVCGGHNCGVEAASGDILAFLDDDATFEHVGALVSMRQRFVDAPGLGIIAANSYLTETGKPEHAAIPRRDKQVLDSDYESSYFCGVGFAVRKDVFDRIGLFFVPYVYG